MVNMHERRKQWCRWPALCAAAAVLLAAGGMAQAQAPKVYTVAKVVADATAKNAVAAKKKALSEARRRALTTLLKRITPFGATERLPKLKPALIEEMVSGLSVRRERNSRTQYLATLDFEFQPQAVQQLLVGYNIPFTDVQSPSIKILPVLVSGGKVDASGRDPWRKAWRGLDLAHALTPAKLLQATPQLTPATLDAFFAGDRGALGAVNPRYDVPALVIALAEPAPDAGLLKTRIYGVDAAGAFQLERRDRIYDGDLKATARRAAHIALRIIEGRWKVTQSDEAGFAASAVPRAVSLTVQFAGLREWQVIRDRLERVPGVRDLKIDALSARAARITVEFPGGIDRLADKLASRDFSLQDVNGIWVLRAF